MVYVNSGGKQGITHASQMTGSFWDDRIRIPAAYGITIGTDGIQHRLDLDNEGIVTDGYINADTANITTKIDTKNIDAVDAYFKETLLTKYGGIINLNSTNITTLNLTAKTTVNFVDTSIDLSRADISGECRFLSEVNFPVGLNIEDTPLLTDGMITESLYTPGIAKASQMVGDFWDADLHVGNKRKVFIGDPDLAFYYIELSYVVGARVSAYGHVSTLDGYEIQLNNTKCWNFRTNKFLPEVIP